MYNLLYGRNEHIDFFGVFNIQKQKNIEGTNEHVWIL